MAEVKAWLKNRMNPNLPADTAQIVERIRDYLRTADMSECTLADLSALFDAPVTTLQNRLKRHGTSWQALKLAEKRRRMADWLEEPGRKHSYDACELLGYEWEHCFYRFFQQVYGETFTAWRMRRQSI